MDIRNEIEALRTELHRHNYNYYVLSQPTISDYDFDQKMRHLQELESRYPEYYDPNSPTQRVGSDISKEFKQVKHRYPMLSLGNTYSKEEVSEFIERTKRFLGEDIEIVCELKFDGTSISLTYEGGRLVRAVTRGDGEQGDDVTDNVKTIRSIPLQLPKGDWPEEMEVRGEVLMPWSVFEQLNKERAEQEEPLFANPRNAASGTLKLQNSSEVAKRHLDSYQYFVIGDGLKEETHYGLLMKAREWGFKVSEALKIAHGVDEVFDYINYWDIERKNLPVATDGIVLKVNSKSQQERLGYTAKSPRWAIAYKFQAERACTRLNSVSFQVGRTGKITPVANLDAVQLSGTVVKRASLHNADIIKSLDLHIGDMVYVEKGGEIIPKIVGVDTSARILLGDVVRFPSRCPECGATLVRNEDEAAHYCPNETACPPQIKGKIEHFVSRKAMNINIGEEGVELLYQHEILHDVADLYTLREEDLIQLERWGAKSARNLIESVEESKKVPFDRVLFALGIRYVGETVAKKLAGAMQSIDRLKEVRYEELLLVEEIGEKIAQSVENWFQDEANLRLVERLRSAGLQMEKQQTETGEKLKNLSFVISGTFDRHSREELKALIEQNGGKNSTSVSSKTDYLLAGHNMGPSKLEKAGQLGIKIIGEEDFEQMIGSGQAD
ncbi:MAG: NAD-dependent DNA ligase LigA [Paludibacteraceae bacterium]|nr:NAD-dependent DNA ligase LigA [Paludibacteraceae bacterium]